MRSVIGDDANVFVIARDVERQRILLGGLGGLGVGQMWMKEELHHKRYKQYKKAEIVDSKIYIPKVYF